MTERYGTDGTSSAEVLIVGAGPVGLVAACELLQQGIPVRIIERAPHRSGHSRAIAVWPRSLELLARVGASRPLSAAGNHLDAVGYYSEGRLLGTIDLCRIGLTPYPFGLIVPQARTEDVLAARLAELGGQIERGIELASLDLSGARPLATLRRETGETERVSVGWLIGADGARSSVRALAGIPFTAEGPEVLFAIGDGAVEGDFDPHVLQYCYSRRGALGLAPFGQGRFRVAVSVPRWDTDQPPPRELFQTVLDDRAPVPGRMRSLEWSTIFAARRHTAATFRAGRCFLAGDAAHIFSAAGGQGMNTGIQDAVNLAWKLGGVLRGRLDERVLDSYDPERRPAADRISAFTARQTSWGIMRGRARLAARDLLVRGAAVTGALHRVGAPLTAQHDIRYGMPRTWRDVAATAAGLSSPAAPGDRFPLFAPGRDGVDPPHPWPVARPDVFTVLLRTRGPRDSAWADRCARIAAALPEGAEVLDISGWPGLDRVAGAGSGAMIVRPDGHVASGWCAAEPSAVGQTLSRAHAKTPGSGWEGAKAA